MNGIRKLLPGLLIVVAIAAPSFWIGSLVPIVGGPIIAIVLGMAIGNALLLPARAAPGIRFCSKRVLQWAIIFQGTGLSLSQVWETGIGSLGLMLVTFLVAFGSAYALGKWLDIPRRLQLLIGVGTAICGGSAIAAVSPVVKAREEEIAYAMATIFLFNVAAALAFPAIGHLLHLSDSMFGLWAGTAINDTSSVVAAGYAYTEEAGDYATIVKLTRSTMIIPVTLVLALVVGWRGRREIGARDRGTGVGGAGSGETGGRGTGSEGPDEKVTLMRLIPWFIVGFLVASGLRTTGIISDELAPQLRTIGTAMIVIAAAAIGLTANFRRMFSISLKPVALGFSVWLALSVASIAYILVFES
ncbi:YeiH family protein [Paenibacillus cymbidii]|uniref:YeiH family protein n=1 Tax=Paenibacillus cymbidii TaxID=1639034 RepID=UPI001081C893|nr:YeiH family protein [Paenibacillus cymbidii]